MNDKIENGGITAQFIQLGICPCGCGRVSILHLNKDDSIISSWQITPDKMLETLEELRQDVLKSIPSTTTKQ